MRNQTATVTNATHSRTVALERLILENETSTSDRIVTVTNGAQCLVQPRYETINTGDLNAGEELELERGSGIPGIFPEGVPEN